MKELSFRYAILFICLIISSVGRSNGRKFIPDHAKIHFAGSIGLVSAGVGWSYGGNKQWESDLYVGYLPKFDGDENSISITIKQHLDPWDIDLKRGWSVDPFTTAISINYLTGDNLWVLEPEPIPVGYYSIPTALRINISVGQRIVKRLSEESLFSAYSLFYEWNTNDLYIVTMATNSNIDLWDIVKLSFGFKIEF